METTLVAVFTGIAGIALLMQAVALLGLSRSVRKLATRLDGLSTEVRQDLQTLSTKAETLLSSVTGLAERVGGLQESLSTTAVVIQKRVADLDQFLEGATNSARLQVIRIQDMVETTSRRVEDTVETVQKGVLAPVTEVRAVLTGLRVGLKYLLRSRKHPSSRSPQDEEMFI